MVAALTAGDATGASVALKQEILQSQGFDARIYCRLAAPGFRNVVVWPGPVKDLARDKFFMTSLAHCYDYGWETDMLDALSVGRSKTRRLVYFHGITPREFVPEALKAGVDRSYAQLRDANRADVLLHATRYSRDMAVAAGVVKPRFVQLPLPLDLPAPTRTESYAGIARFLSVGRMAESKGQFDLLHALAKLKAGGLGNWTLRLIYNEQTAHAPYLEAVRAAAAALDLMGQVEFVGTVTDRQQMAEHYARSDLTILASRAETYCLPLLESLSSGTPVVAYASGAIPEVARGCAFLVPSGDLDALAAAIGAAAARLPLLGGDDIPPISRADFYSTCRTRLSLTDRDWFSRVLLVAITPPPRAAGFRTAAGALLARLGLG